MCEAHSLGKGQKEQSLNQPHSGFWGHTWILNWVVVGRTVVLHFLCLEMEFSKIFGRKRRSAANCLTEVLKDAIMSVTGIQKLRGAIK